MSYIIATGFLVVCGLGFIALVGCVIQSIRNAGPKSL